MAKKRTLPWQTPEWYAKGNRFARGDCCNGYIVEPQVDLLALKRGWDWLNCDRVGAKHAAGQHLLFCAANLVLISKIRLLGLKVCSTNSISFTSNKALKL